MIFLFIIQYGLTKNHYDEDEEWEKDR